MFKRMATNIDTQLKTKQQRLSCVFQNSRLLSDRYMVYRVSWAECGRVRENVPYVKVHGYNPKHLYTKFSGYGDNGQRSLKV